MTQRRRKDRRDDQNDEQDILELLEYNLQKEVIPNLGEGHSGKSFGAAMFLASMFLQRPALIAKAHGALCPLVGCDDYGCYATVANAA